MVQQSFDQISSFLETLFFPSQCKVLWTPDLDYAVYKLTMTCCMVGLRTGFLLFNTPFSFSTFFVKDTGHVL